ncbi:MAG: CpaF family protein [Proteobacteria bacterium]|nr:CpaF family protein [Pseudomonadota bacterium]
MSLRNRLEDASRAVALTHPTRTLAAVSSSRAYQEVKARIHHMLLDRVDLAVMERLPAVQVAAELKHLVEMLLVSEAAVLNQSEREQIVRDIQNEVQGLGPLEALLADPTVSDILVNTSKQVYVERRGRLEPADIRFEDDAHVCRIIDKIVSAIGRRIDESSPMVDARLQDGSRVNAIIPPLAIDGPILSIRRFAVIPLKMADLIVNKSLTEPMAEILAGLVKAKVNTLISGGTGTGKTTLLNVLSASIAPTERIITIEDAAELQLQQPHVVRLETRPPNIEGRGEVTQRALVRNSLRMRPDRIIVGEVRGGEVVDMLQAMNTGHDGSMTTVHANGTRDALLRLENMVGMSGLSMTAVAIRQQITSALTVIVQVSRLSDGTRRVTSIEEITGMENDIITTQQVFAFTQTGILPDGSVQGFFSATGIRPRFADRLRVRGIPVGDDVFDPERIYQ